MPIRELDHFYNSVDISFFSVFVPEAHCEIISHIFEGVLKGQPVISEREC